ncbi:MAG TPA: hypothetical protein VF921_15620, partial [Vicinamibacterales bacterium]
MLNVDAWIPTNPLARSPTAIYEELRARQTTLSGLFAANDTPYPSFGGVDDAARKAQRAERYRLFDERLNAVSDVRAASVSWLGLFSMQDLWLPLIDPDRSDDRPIAVAFPRC